MSGDKSVDSGKAADQATDRVAISLDPIEALKGLLAVDPDDEPADDEAENDEAPPID